MKPCIIKPTKYNTFNAINEDGMIVVIGTDFSNVLATANERHYTQVPLNSRCGRTIMDKYEKKLSKY